MRFLRASILLPVLIFICAFANAQQVTPRFSISVGGGYQVENSNWSIAGNSNGTNPNIYSELMWKKLQSPTVQASASWRFYKAFSLRAGFSRAFIQSGKVTDTDYGKDDRQQPVYNGVFKDDKGNITAYTATLAYTFSHTRYTLTPLLGYMYNRQALYVLPADAGTPADLNTTYTARWQGATIGLEATWLANKHFSLTPSVQYYQLQYDATANWNLITQFQHPVSFTHAANGFAIAPGVQAAYHINAHTQIFLNGHYTHWDTGHGRDVLYLTSGEVDHTRLNEVKRDDTGVAAGITFSW